MMVLADVLGSIWFAGLTFVAGVFIGWTFFPSWIERFKGRK